MQGYIPLGDFFITIEIGCENRVQTQLTSVKNSIEAIVDRHIKYHSIIITIEICFTFSKFSISVSCDKWGITAVGHTK